MKDTATRPYVLVNMAMTADGKIATANRALSSFGSDRDKQHLLELRATADAVMAGARTVDLNPVNLGPGPARYRRMRLQAGLLEYNIRIIVSGSASINPKAAVFRKHFSPIIILTTGQAPPKKLRVLKELADEVRICGEKEIAWRPTLRWLRETWQVRRLLCEGGGGLNDALFRAGLVDELHLTICPLVFGGKDAPTISDGTGNQTLIAASRFKLKSLRRNGGELFSVYTSEAAAG